MPGYCAEAVLDAMREPDEAMVKAGGNGQTIYARGKRRGIYRAMIDAAKAEDAT